jgi:hypothetical protein
VVVELVADVVIVAPELLPVPLADPADVPLLDPADALLSVPSVPEADPELESDPEPSSPLPGPQAGSVRQKISEGARVCQQVKRMA